MSKKSCAYAPGKMYLIGEYAVVQEGHPAILLSINKGVTVNIEESEQYSIQSNKYDNQLVSLDYVDEQVVCDDTNYTYALAAINTCLKTIENHKPFKISIVSELDNIQHKKYGLGSSSAMIVAIIRAMSHFFKIDRSLDEVFKLSVLAQLQLSKHSSFGDIATSVYGGCIYYVKGSIDWINPLQEFKSIISQDWDGFVIKRLPLKMLNNVVGYSGVHASSTELVKEVFKIKESKQFDDFLSQAKKIVNQCKDAILYDNEQLFYSSITNYRNLLVTLQEISNVSIEIEIIKKMIERVYAFHGVAKTSGAGGGDCVIAFAKDSDSIKEIKKEWEALGAEIIHSIKWG